ncbi:winged helix DNA-binding domain-containing protein [Lentzea tibetensis]|uniref:winged helix DNA-binding domain-containing protein n=1 Tax=Lentzea tibetensis TaxID=2591470 RepID=UPI001646C1D7|nr:winged helix DNA-binding domain-containing protein [Lentzea tibetensis]
MELTAAQTRVARTHAQLLAGPRSDQVADAVRHVVALQGQDVRANRMSVRVRTNGLTGADVDAACAAGSVVRTWAMRGTLHMLAAEDVGWVVGLLGPRFAFAFRSRRLQLGLDEATCDRATGEIREVLAGGKVLTRAEIMAAIDVDVQGQAQAHLLGYAALTGVICRGPEMSDAEPAYTLLEEWAGPSEVLPEEKAQARLAQRYLAAYGPATAEDFAAWSGLPLGPARAGFAEIAAQLREVVADGRVAYVLDDPVLDDRTTVRLFGHFETYLLGYRTRENAVPAEYAKVLQTGGGFIMPSVSVNGRIAGLWKHAWRKEQKQDLMVVTLEPFGVIAKQLLPAIRAEVADIGRFLGVRARLDVE